MEDTNELLKTLIAKFDAIESNLKKDFAGVNKRLDGIDYELKKINTVVKYQQEYDNIPA